MLGNDADENGCRASAGFEWCEAKGRCIRSFEEACETPEDDDTAGDEDDGADGADERSSSGMAPVATWAQCGGRGLDGCNMDDACAPCADPNNYCRRGNQWYWQCVIGSDPSESTSGGGGAPANEVAQESEELPIEEEEEIEEEIEEEVEEVVEEVADPGANDDDEAASTLTEVEQWAQCGGTNYDGCNMDAACAPCADPDFYCARGNEW